MRRNVLFNAYSTASSLSRTDKNWLDEQFWTRGFCIFKNFWTFFSVHSQLFSLNISSAVAEFAPSSTG